MRGFCEKTGKIIEGEEFLEQCIKRVLFIPTGTLKNYREFGSKISCLIGAPQSRKTILDLCSEGAQTLEKWIDGLKIVNIELGEMNRDGILTLSVNYKINGKTGVLEVNNV